LRKLFDACRTLVYASGFVLLWAWLAWTVRPYDRSLGIALPGWTRALGVVFMILGGILAAFAAGTFVVHGRGTPAPFDAPREFVATGVYKYVRNPMYIGGWTVLAGYGFFLRSVSVLMLSLGMLLLAHLFVLVYEEPILRSKFGPAYREYCRSVPRWIPRKPDGR